MSWLDEVLTLPLPPTANRLVAPFAFRGPGGKPVARLIATTEAREFRKEAQRLLRGLQSRLADGAPLKGPLELYATFFLPTIASDSSNRMKALEDSMQGIVFENDRQVAEHHSQKSIAYVGSDLAPSPRVIVTIRRADNVQPEFAKRLAAAKSASPVTR